MKQVSKRKTCYTPFNTPTDGDCTKVQKLKPSQLSSSAFVFHIRVGCFERYENSQIVFRKFLLSILFEAPEAIAQMDDDSNELDSDMRDVIAKIDNGKFQLFEPYQFEIAAVSLPKENSRFHLIVDRYGTPVSKLNQFQVVDFNLSLDDCQNDKEFYLQQIRFLQSCF